MATQNSGHQPTHFSISTPFKHVRLIEVPDELLSIITSSSSSTSTSPTQQQQQQQQWPLLKFKSATQPRTSTTSASANIKEPILHLCTPTAAWAVKQVSTSNSVYVTQPTHLASSANDHGDEIEVETEADALHSATRNGGAVTAIAQVGNFLELHRVAIDEDDVVDRIVQSLPLWHDMEQEQGRADVGVDTDMDMDLELQRWNDARSSVSMVDLVDGIAAPDEIVRRACARLAVVEMCGGGDDGKGEGQGGRKCYVPSTRTLLQAWSVLVEASALNDVNLTSGDIDIDRIIALVAEAATETDTVVVAVLETLFRLNGGTFKMLQLMDESGRFEPQGMCRFIAGLLLSATASRDGIDGGEFVRRWTDLVPASWVKYCTIENLVGESAGADRMSGVQVSRQGDGEVVSWNGQRVLGDTVLLTALSKGVHGQDGNGVGGDASTGGGTNAKAVGDKKRKWHEKFAAQRNLKP